MMKQLINATTQMTADPAIIVYTIIYLFLVLVILLVTILLYKKHFKYTKAIVIINTILLMVITFYTFQIIKEFFLEGYELQCWVWCNRNYRSEEYDKPNIKTYYDECHNTCVDYTFKAKTYLKDLKEEDKQGLEQIILKKLNKR